VSAVDVTGADAAMTLAAIERPELGAAVDTLRIHLTSPNVEVRAMARTWVDVGVALIAGGDVTAAIRSFDEVVALLTRPKAERLALLQAREAVNTTSEGTNE
jgi:ABC-type tungstate transport system substrate-binding protein